jgi:Na+/H+ antiporter NhaD/arsenite permease-like protein
MINRHQLNAFVRAEWLLMLSAAGFLLTSIIAWRIPSYTVSDFEILYILFVLFIVTTGLKQHGVLERIAQQVEAGNFIPLKMVLAAFFFSMVVTNDVALMTLVPLTVLLNVPYKAWLVIAEVLAANAGSALSPFGNPQNLFIYWHYDISSVDLVITIAPFSLVFLGLLAVSAVLINDIPGKAQKAFSQKSLSPIAYFYVMALIVFILAILRLLPLTIGGVIIFYVLLADRASLRIDYALLVTFAVFFGFTDNLRVMLNSILAHPHHVFLLSALLSQIISNVPTALLLADFTPHWQSLLWGVSVGGFGSLVGSLASLIAYRIYVRTYRNDARSFLIRFHIASYAAFFTGILLYFIILKT